MSNNPSQFSLLADSKFLIFDNSVSSRNTKSKFSKNRWNKLGFFTVSNFVILRQAWNKSSFISASQKVFAYISLQTQHASVSKFFADAPLIHLSDCNMGSGSFCAVVFVSYQLITKPSLLRIIRSFMLLMNLLFRIQKTAVPFLTLRVWSTDIVDHNFIIYEK